MNLNKSSNFGSQNKVILKKIQHIQDQINTDDSSRVIRGHLNVIYWSKDEKQLEKIAAQIKTEFKELDIIPYYPSSEERKNYFLNSYCCFSSNISNEDLYVTDLKHALCLLTPVKAVKGMPDVLKRFDRACNDLYSRGVSKIRQPIEALFSWLIEKSDIQKESKVRSTKGLTLHAYGRLVAAFITLIF